MKKRMIGALSLLTLLSGCEWFNEKQEDDIAREIEKTIKEIEEEMGGFHHQELPDHTPNLGGNNRTIS